MTSSGQSRSIVVAGASGQLGKVTVEALLATGLHKVSVITRVGSQATFPEGVKVHCGEYEDEAFLTSVLAGQDVLVVTVANGTCEVQRPLFRAAAAAKVPWVVPCEYGCDVDGKLNDHVPMMREKVPYRELIEQLGVSSWIGVVNGPWFDYSTRYGALGVNLAARTAVLQGDGTTFGVVKANFTTLPQTGKSLAALLSLPEERLLDHKNGWVYFSSFYINQRELLASAIRATGTQESDWSVTERKSADVMAESKEQLATGNPMAMVNLLISLIFMEGMGGDFNAKVIDYSQLGLKPENLDEVLREIGKQIGAV